jgi:hypothetical protein
MPENSRQDAMGAFKIVAPFLGLWAVGALPTADCPGQYSPASDNFKCTRRNFDALLVYIYYLNIYNAALLCSYYGY